MSPFAAFLIGLVPAYAAGALSRPFIDRMFIETREHMPHPVAEKRRLVDVVTQPVGILVMLAITTVVACGALIYTVRVENESSASDDALIDCINTYIVRSSTASMARAKATEERDKTLTKALATASAVTGQASPTEQELVRARVALAEYRTAAAKLDAVRNVRPLPDFGNYCAELRAKR